MQEQVTVSGERGVVGRSLDWATTRFGRKPINIVFRGVTMLLVFIVIAIVIGVAVVLVVYSWPTIQAFGLSFLTIRRLIQCIIPLALHPPSSARVYLTVRHDLRHSHRSLSSHFRGGFLPAATAHPAGFLHGLAGGIPSVIIGLFGFLLLAPWLQTNG